MTQKNLRHRINHKFLMPFGGYIPDSINKFNEVMFP